MIQSQSTKPNAVLALAQYAYTRVEPLFAQAKTIEPSVQFSIELVFADDDSAYANESHVRIYSHWKRTRMFQWSDWLQSMEDVDRYAAKLADDVANLQPVDVAA